MFNHLFFFNASLTYSLRTFYHIGEMGDFYACQEYQDLREKWGRVLYSHCTGLVKQRTILNNYAPQYATLEYFYKVFRCEKSLCVSQQICCDQWDNVTGHLADSKRFLPFWAVCVCVSANNL